MKQKQIDEPTQTDFSRQSTKMTTHRELTRDTFKSSTSTRSGTLSSGKSSAKLNDPTDQDDEEKNEKQTPYNEPQEQTNCKRLFFVVFCFASKQGYY